MEGFEFIEDSFKIMREKLEAEYMAKLKEHRENISTELNKLEFTENYGRLPDEIKIYKKEIVQHRFNDSSNNYKLIHGYSLFNYKYDTKLSYIVHIISYSIRKYYNEHTSSGNFTCTNQRGYAYDFINLLIDNCGNCYKYIAQVCYDCKINKTIDCRCRNYNKLILLNKKATNIPLNNKLIDTIKQIKIPPDFYENTLNEFNTPVVLQINYLNVCGDHQITRKDNPNVCRDYCKHSYDSTILIEYFINEFCANIREMNEYYYKQFVNHLPYETLKAEFDEISEEKRVFDEKYDKIENKYKIASEKLSAIENELNQANSTLLAYKAEIDKLTEKIRARDALIVNLTIQNTTNSAPPPYSA